MVQSDDELHITHDFHKLHYEALFYFLSMKELAPLKQHLTIVIGDEMSAENVELYEAFCVSSLFPPAKRYPCCKWLSRSSVSKPRPSVQADPARMMRQAAILPMDRSFPAIRPPVEFRSQSTMSMSPTPYKRSGCIRKWIAWSTTVLVRSSQWLPTRQTSIRSPFTPWTSFIPMAMPRPVPAIHVPLFQTRD